MTRFMKTSIRSGWRILLPGLAILFLVFLSSCQCESEPQTQQEQLEKHVKFLAADELEGRGAGSEGNLKAAEYIRNQFKKAGLKQFDGDYFQKFEVTTAVKLGEGNRAAFNIDGTESEWQPEVQYIPLTSSENDTASGGLVFAGYGISAEDEKFDEYAGLNVTGKIVLVLRGSPDYENPHGKLGQYAELDYKLRNAKEKGAIGVIAVSSGDLKDELMELNVRTGNARAGVVALHAKRDAVDALLPEGKKLADLEAAIQGDMAPHSFALEGASGQLIARLDFIKKPTYNVVGYVPGTVDSLKDQYIVVGAHYDHLGWGNLGGSRYSGDEPMIHHGADDNASGTAAMMGVAADIAKAPLPRPVVFAGFSGEEIGLLGSAHYCENPPVPLENTILMVNMDMVGRVNEHKINITGTGTSPSWDSLIDSLSAIYELQVSKTADGFGPSDHASFYARNIPVINLFTGLHDDYHRPSDTWDKINYAGLDTVVEFAGDIVETVGEYKKRPEFVKVKTDARQGQRMTFRVSSGVIPDYSDNPKGMRITGVKDDGPAAKAGMQAGDIIIKFGETEVKTIYDYTYCLGKYKPGDQVTVLVLRGESEEPLALEMTLDAR